MHLGGAIAPAVYLGCLRSPPRGTARMRRRWPHSAPETRLPHSPDAWQPGIPIRTRTTRMSGASGGVIAFWPRARPSGSAATDRLLRQVTEGNEDHRSRVPGPGGDASSIFEPDCQRVGGSFRNKVVKSGRRKRHSGGWSPSMGHPGFCERNRPERRARSPNVLTRAD